MKTISIFLVSIIMALLIPAIDAKPVIIGFNEKIDQNLINPTLPLTSDNKI